MKYELALRSSKEPTSALGNYSIYDREYIQNLGTILIVTA